MAYLRFSNNLRRKKYFWFIRGWLNNKKNVILHYIWKIFLVRNRLKKELNNNESLIKSSGPIVLQKFLLSIFIIFSLHIFSKCVCSTEWSEIKYLCFDEWAGNTVPSFAGVANILFSSIAGISWVFLGLYFTALSGIASAFLVEANRNVRVFFLSIPLGREYTDIVALTWIISLWYIILNVFGYIISPIEIAFVSILAVHIVFSFWSVGTSIFSALEPSDALPWIEKEIFKSIKSVTISGFKWRIPNMQLQHQYTVIYYLGTMENLINFWLNKIKLSDQQFITALHYDARMLLQYSLEKWKIPTKSLWYKQKNQYQSWSLANSTQIILALNSGTDIHPQSVQDFTWFEEKVLNRSETVIKSLIEKNKIWFAHQGIMYFFSVAEIYGRNFDILWSKMLLKKLSSANKEVYWIDKKVFTDESSLYKEQLAFIDSQCVLVINFLVGFMNYVLEQSENNISNIINKVDWRPWSKTIYQSGLPPVVNERFELIAQEIYHEKLIEGRKISPKWYIENICVQEYLLKMEEYLNYIKSLHKDYFQPQFDYLVEMKLFSSAAHFTQRWIEYSNKYQRSIDIIKVAVEWLEKYRQVEDLPWTNFNYDEERKMAANRIKEANDRLITLLPKLSKLVIWDDLPDYFWQALTLGLEWCYEACRDNNVERFGKIMPIVLNASLVAHDITRERTQNWTREDSKLVYSTEPLMNVFEISGYAKLYWELYGNDAIWSITKALWDEYIKSAPDAKKAIEFIAAISRYRDTLFTIMPQANLRSNWQITFEHKMREKGIPIFPYDRDARHEQNSRIVHESPLIRVVSRQSSTLSLPRNVFFTTYLSGLPSAVGIDLPGTQKLKRQIEEESSNPESSTEYE